MALVVRSKVLMMKCCTFLQPDVTLEALGIRVERNRQ